MLPKIATMTLPLPNGLGSANCYLIETDIGYLLIDTGCSNQRTHLEKALESRGCQPGNLQLIVLTHGDFDHTGNAAYLRDKFSTQLAMHEGDGGMVEYGDIFWNRKKGNILIEFLARMLFRFGKSARFKPDCYLKEGDDLSEYGFNAQVLDLPGHSKGSIGILTTEGDLFCGDLLTNLKKPALNSLMDDLAAAKVSIEKLKRLAVNMVYPGHGKPFKMELLLQGDRTV